MRSINCYFRECAPSSAPLRRSRTFLTMLLMLSMLAAMFPPHVFALNSGDLTFTLVTPFLAQDSNNSCAAGPKASYIEVLVTNPAGGTGALSNLSANISSFAGAAGVTLDSGETAIRYIGTLADGAAFPLYFYVNYPCQVGSNPPPISSTFTTTVSDGVTAALTSGTLTLTTRSEISANAGGQVTNSTIGPGAVIGQIIPMTVNYDFGNPGGAQVAMVQPAGNVSFDSGCFRLMSVDITAVTGFTAGLTTAADDRLYFTAVNGAASNTATVVYYFKMLCNGASTTANPFSDLTSGGQLKYTGNFGTCSATGAICPAYPTVTNPFTISKSVSPTSLPAGGTATYTVVINNPSAYASKIDSIADTLPPGVTFAAISGASQVNAANSSSVPAASASGTITFAGVPTTSCVGGTCNGSYSIAANSSLTLIYTANVPNTAGTYTNSAAAALGSVVIGPATANVGVGSADLAITKNVNSATPNVGTNVTYTVQVTNTGPSAATGVAVSDLLPTGLTYVSSTPSQGTYTSGTGAWAVGALANGASATLTIVATVTQPGTITNTASVSASSVPDPTPGNNSASASLNGQQADLAVTKSVSNATPNVGTDVTYTIQIINNGPSAASGVAVSDLLPAGLAYVASTPSQGSYTSGTGFWTVGALANSASATLTIVATVTQPGAISNTAAVSAADQPDSITGNNSSSSALNGQQADLAVTKSVSNATPNVGTNVTFTVQATNNGPSATAGVAVSDLLPTGLTYVSSTPSQGTYASGTGVWSIGALANGASATLTIVATVTQAGAILNTAAVSASNVVDPTPGNNTASATVTGQQADLVLTKSVDNVTPNVGTNVTYTIQVVNNGPSAATGIAVSDLLPAGLTYVSSAPSQGTYTSGTGAWVVGALANGASATLTIAATVTQPGASTNTASISAADQPDPTSANNTDSTIVTGQQADLAVTKIVDNPAATIGDTVMYTVQVSNHGPSAATGVAVSDLLPAGLTYVSSTPSQGTYSSGTGAWDVGTLANGANATLTIVANVTQLGTITNIASISASDQPDPNSANNTKSVSTPSAIADLAVTKNVGTTTPNVGTAVTFTIQVTNSGPSAATGVVVSDLLPAGLVYVSSAPSQGSYTSGTGAWAVGTLANGANATLTIVATVTQTGAITNIASIVAADQSDPIIANDSASATVTGQQVDLAVTKSVNTATPNVGTNVTYTVQVSNSGPSAATGVAVSDLLPAGLTYVSSTSSHGSYTSGTGAWAIGTLANGAGATLTIIATVTQASAIVNTAAISASDQPDPISANDTDSVTVTGQQADLAVTKSVSNVTPNVGTNVTFSVQVTNNGPSAASGVAVSDLLPAGLTYISSTPSQGTYTSGTGLWSIGTLANGATATLTIVATVIQASAIVNTAAISASDQPDPISANDSDSATATGQQADLAVTKSVGNPTPNVGTNVTYTVQVTNSGPSAASGVEVSDLLPPGLIYVSSTPSQGSYTSGTGLWTVGALPNGASATLTIVATVTQASPIVNTAAISASDQPDPTSANDSGSATVTGQQADLAVTKSVGNPTPNVGTNVTYTVQVTNSGPSAASGVAVSDLLPAGLTYVSSTPSQGSYTSGTGLWMVGTLANGASATLTIVATVTQAGAITNTAVISAADQPDPSSANNTGSAAIGGQQADLAVTKSVDNATPNVGANMTYTIQVNNTGPSDATGIAVSDLLPTGLTYVTSTPSQGSYSSGTGLWTVGALANGASATLTIVATVTQAGAITNIATISAADQPDPTSTNNSDSTTATGQQADLAITKSVNTATPNVGTNATYTVQVTNNGPSAASGVVVSDLLPAGLTYVASTPSQGSYASGTGLWAIGALANGASVTLTIVATVAQAGAITNIATISAADQLDVNGANNSASATVTGQQADLAVSKTVNTIAPSVGANVTFTILVSNNGPSDATSVVISDLLPTGLTYVASTPNQGTYTSGTGLWTIGTLANGASATLTIVATVAQAGTMINTAAISAADQPDPNSANNSDTATVTGQQADLAVTKSANSANPGVGTNIIFTVQVTNNGPSAATGVVVSDLLPAALTYVSSAPSQGSYASGTGIWTVGALANGASATLTIVATVTQAGTITNTATISAADQPDLDSANNSASAAVGGQSADLAVTKTVDTATPNVGANVTYTIQLTNNGPSAASGVVVTDLLPAGLTYVSSTPSQGTYTSGTGAWNVGALANGAGATLMVVATVTQVGSINNTAMITGATQPDPNSANNSASVTLTGQQADLGVTKTVDSSAPNVGANVTYTIRVTNSGPSAATGVAVSDLLPAGLTYVSSTPSQGTYTSGTGVWAVGALANGTSATLTIVATVVQVSTIVNAANISASDLPDPNGADNSGSVAIGGQAADLAITKTVDNVAPHVGANVTYTIQVTNTGPSVATGVILSDLLPSGLVFVSSTPSQGAYTSSSGSWAVGTLASGVQATLAIVATVTQMGTIVNTASISVVDQPDPNVTNNSSSVTLGTPTADLSVAKTVNTTSANLGDQLVYTVTIHNSGPDDATGVIVSDQLPSGLTYVSSTPSQGTYTSATGAWIVGALANGASVALQIRVTVVATGAIVNTAQVTASDQFDPNSTPGNNTPGENDQALASISASPTAISLASFTATRRDHDILIQWTTSAEINTWGFALYRSADEIRAHAIRITPDLVPGRGRGQGATYAWTDTTGIPGTSYSYWLKEIEVNGTTNEYGPARLANGPATSGYRIFLPVAIR